MTESFKLEPDFALQLLALRSEALLWLHKLEEADSTITSLLKLDDASLPSTPTRVSGMSADSYVHIVQAKVNVTFGRYEYRALGIVLCRLLSLVLVTQ